MRKIFALFLAIISIFILGSCSNNNSSNSNINSTTIEKNESSKILLTYFSRADENYSVGYIDKGNTEWLADFIDEKLNVDKTFKIERITPYPATYKECTDEAKKEQNDNARPEIKGNVSDFNEYDIIFLGYPIWWGDVPMCVYTFMEAYDFNGKIVIPFSTHEGSGWGSSLNTLKNKLSGSTIYQGYNCRGSEAKNNKDSINSWLEGLGF